MSDEMTTVRRGGYEAELVVMSTPSKEGGLFYKGKVFVLLILTRSLMGAPLDLLQDK